MVALTQSVARSIPRPELRPRRVGVVLNARARKVDDETLSWIGITRNLRALGAYAPYQWHLETTGKPGTLDVRIRAEPTEFVALRYPNPPGGTKICMNSKLAHCEITVRRPNQTPLVLHSSRAAFEILDDTAPPGVEPKV